MAEHQLERDQHGREAEAPVQHDPRLRRDGRCRSRYQAPVAATHMPWSGRRPAACAASAPCMTGPPDDRHPVARDDLAVDDRVADRHLHPAVVGEDPEGRQHGAERHHAAGKAVEPRRHAAAAEHHDAEEGGFQQERREASRSRAAAPGSAPVRSASTLQLVPNWNAMTMPETTPIPNETANTLSQKSKTPPIDRVAGRQRHALDRCEPGGEPDGERRKDDVERDDERELNPRQQYDVHIHQPASPVLCRSRSVDGEPRSRRPREGAGARSWAPARYADLTTLAVATTHVVRLNEHWAPPVRAGSAASGMALSRALALAASATSRAPRSGAGGATASAAPGAPCGIWPPWARSRSGSSAGAGSARSSPGGSPRPGRIFAAARPR